MSSTALTGIRLSPSEKKYVEDGIAHGVRRDGRGLRDLRHVNIKVGLLPQANGSARVRSVFSSTDVICGVKFEVGPFEDNPIQCSVELGTLARADLFGPVEAAKRAERRGVELADALTKWLQGSFELAPLVKGKAQWITFVDCVVLGDGGNLQDVLSLASYCALRDARIPQTIMNEDGTDFDIVADYGAAQVLDHSTFALTTTSWFVCGQILCDPTQEEEACADCAVSVNVDRRGKLRSVSKSAGTGVVSSTNLMNAISAAVGNAKQLLRFVDAELDAEKSAYDSRIGRLEVQDPEAWNEVCLSSRLS